MTICPGNIPGFSYLCFVHLNNNFELRNGTVALGNAAVFAFGLYGPISGDLAAFYVRVDQRTVFAPNVP